MDHEHIRNACERTDEIEILHSVVFHVLEQRFVGRQDRRPHDLDHVAVSRCIEDIRRADPAGSAILVQYDYLLTEFLGQSSGDQAAEHVGAAASSGRHHQFDRLGGVILGRVWLNRQKNGNGE